MGEKESFHGRGGDETGQGGLRETSGTLFVTYYTGGIQEIFI